MPLISALFCLLLSLGTGTALSAAALSPTAVAADPMAAFDFFAQENQVVTATTFQQKLSETPAQVAVITAEDIARHGYRTLNDILETLTGFYSNSDGDYEYLGVRGMNLLGDFSSRILVLVDGNTTNDPIFGTGYAGNELGVDVDAIKRVEVILGPGSALYGTHALFAVINIITKNGDDVRGGTLSVGGGGAANARLGFGADLNAETKLSYGQKFSNGVDFYVQGALLGSQGRNYYFPEYDTPANNVNNGWANGDASESANKFLGKLSYKGLSLEGGVNWRQSGIPSDTNGTLFNNPSSATVDQGGFVEAKDKLSLGPNLDLTLRAYFRAYDFAANYYALGGSSGNDTEDDVSLGVARTLGAEAQLQWQTAANNWLTVGLEGVDNYQQQLETYILDFADASQNQVVQDDFHAMQVGSAYLQDIYKPVESLSLILGGRWDHYSTFGDAFSPRAGVLYTFLEDHTVKLLYGQAFNAPSDYQLNFAFPNSNQPNPNLEAEHLDTYEVVYEYDAGLARFSVDGFQNTMRNLIVGTMNPAGLYEYVNQGSDQSRGLDAKLKGEWRGWRGRIGFEWQNTEDTALGQNEYNSPDTSGHFELSAPLYKRALYLSLDEVYVGPRQETTDQWLDAYVRTDLTLYGTSLLKNLDLTFKVINLFDLTYSDPLTPDPPFSLEPSITLPRRSVYGKMSVNF